MFEIITLLTLILIIVFFIFKTVELYIVHNYFKMVRNIFIVFTLMVILLNLRSIYILIIN